MDKNHKCSYLLPNSYSVITSGKHLQPINGKFTWHIDESCLTPDMDKYKVIFAFTQAFNVWGALLSPIAFQSVSNIEEAQIVIKFKVNGDADLPYEFEEGTLAYAFAPDGQSLGIHSDMYFNDEYKWDEIHKADSIYLFKVVVHEIGHILNLGHQTSDIKDIMYPMYQPTNDVIINNDTRSGIYNLYKSYGVSNTVSNNTGVTLTNDVRKFLKLMYRSVSDITRLKTSQIDSILTILGQVPNRRDSIAKKSKTIWDIISKF